MAASAAGNEREKAHIRPDPRVRRYKKPGPGSEAPHAAEPRWVERWVERRRVWALAGVRALHPKVERWVELHPTVERWVERRRVWALAGVRAKCLGPSNNGATKAEGYKTGKRSGL